MAAQRGRPKSGGELKESSVRIRPGLKAKLEEAAAESGESIASELEGRLEATFTEVPRRGVTHELLQRIAIAVREIESQTGKQWDKDLTTWAMLREVMANGPVIDFTPDPKPADTRNAIEANAELAELQAERTAILKVLRGFGIEPYPATLGSAFLPITADISVTVRQKVEELGLPEQAQGILLEQLDRLASIDPQIADLQRKVNEAMLPWLKAKKKAREWLYGAKGIPNLPEWLTAPETMNEPPRRGMFANR